MLKTPQTQTALGGSEINALKRKLWFQGMRAFHELKIVVYKETPPVEN